MCIDHFSQQKVIGQIWMPNWKTFLLLLLFGDMFDVGTTIFSHLGCPHHEEAVNSKLGHCLSLVFTI